MREPIAYANGCYLPASQATLSWADAGFVQGVTISEQLRTFGGRLFRLEEHLDRLERSLAAVGLSSGMPRDQWQAHAEHVVATNRAQLDPEDDLGVVLFVTPGPLTALDPRATPGPTVGLHTYPLPFARWAAQYEHGERLSVVEVRQVPSRCWSPTIKCRSRLHYYLAEREAAAARPGSRPLLLDEQGFVNETPTANIVGLVADRGLVSPRGDQTLGGISQAEVRRLGSVLGLAWNEVEWTPADWFRADEVWLTSTPFCLVPVVSIDDAPIGTGRPGPWFKRLIEHWGRDVGVDLIAQAARFSRRISA